MKNQICALIFCLMILLSVQIFAVSYSPSTMVNNWSSQASPTSGGANANWTVSGSKVYTGGNVDGALISDFTVDHNFALTGTIQNSGDDDSMGLVWGWQNYQNTYFLELGGGGVGGWNGMSVYKKVSGTVTQLAHVSTNWISGHVYNATITKLGTSYSVVVKDGSSSVFTANYSDSAFSSGKVGIHAYSQAAYYWNIGLDTSVPEPATISLLFCSLLGIIAVRCRLRK